MTGARPDNPWVDYLVAKIRIFTFAKLIGYSRVFNVGRSFAEIVKYRPYVFRVDGNVRAGPENNIYT